MVFIRTLTILFLESEMISFITGKPGGGKGLLTQQQHVDELEKGKRCIITSLPVRVDPWYNGNWEPMIGLRGFLLKKYGKDFEVGTRVFLLDDDQAAEFFLFRVIDGKLVKAEAEYKTTKDGERRLMSYDTSLAAKSGPVLYSIDEAWKHWGSRNWQKTGEGMLFYGAQHRHFGDDVLIVTQHTKQIDPAIQRVAQDFWVVRNHGKMSFGMFRQPAVFSVCIYDQAPTGAQIEPMSRKLFTLDKAGLAQTYDTSAGVGLAGRMVADVGARTKGLPWYFMLVVVFGLLALIWVGIKFGSHLVTHVLVKSGPPITKAIESSVKTEKKPVDEFLRPVSDPHLEEKLVEQTNEVFCCGWSILPGGRVWVDISDGRVCKSEDGEVQLVRKRLVNVMGVQYAVKKREAEFEKTSVQGAFENPTLLQGGNPSVGAASDTYVERPRRLEKITFR